MCTRFDSQWPKRVFRILLSYHKILLCSKELFSLLISQYQNPSKLIYLPRTQLSKKWNHLQFQMIIIKSSLFFFFDFWTGNIIIRNSTGQNISVTFLSFDIKLLQTRVYGFQASKKQYIIEIEKFYERQDMWRAARRLTVLKHWLAPESTITWSHRLSKLMTLYVKENTRRY